MAKPPSADSILRNMKKQKLVAQKFESKAPIATDMLLPNHSGDHSAGRMSRTPENETDLVNKEYVDSIATRSEINLFLTNNASDIGTYKDLEVGVITAAKENIVQSITANSTTLIASFATILNEAEIDDIELLENGIYGLHLHAEGANAKNLFFYCEFYKRVAGGTETLLGTSHDSSQLTTSEAEYNVHASITSDTAWVAGDRIVIKVYGRNNSNAARNVTIYMEGDTASRAELPGFRPPGGGGDVTAAANLTDNTVVLGDGGAKGVKSSAVTDTELETLTDNSMADALHRHSELSASDGTPDKIVYTDAAGILYADASPLGLDVQYKLQTGSLDVLAGNITVTGTVDGIDIATDVAANTAKNTNVTTNITVAEAPTNVDIQSSDGSNDTIAAADVTNAGVMTTTMYDEHVVNNNKVTYVKTNVKGHIEHGGTAGTGRPSGFTSVEWVGTVEPTNASNGDTWIDTT